MASTPKECQRAMEAALTIAVPETIKASPPNPVLYLAHRLIEQAPPSESKADPGADPSVVVVTADDSRRLKKLASFTLKKQRLSILLSYLAPSVISTALLVQSAITIAKGDVYAARPAQSPAHRASCLTCSWCA